MRLEGWPRASVGERPSVQTQAFALWQGCSLGGAEPEQVHGIDLEPLAFVGLIEPDPVGLGAPVRAAGKFLGAPGAEQALVGEVRDPGLALGGAVAPTRAPDRSAHGLGYFAHLLGAAAAMLDHALEEVGALPLPVDAGKGLRQ